MNESVVIYDPNYLNPYGYELASLLADTAPIMYWCPRDVSRAQLSNVSTHAKLSPRRGGANRIRRAFQRLTGPLFVVLAAGRRPLLVVWTRDPWDTLVLTVRARLIGKTFVVYHNPRQVRPRPGLSGRVEQQLLRRSSVIVHSAWLAEVVREDFPHAVTLPHPPYFETTKNAPDWSLESAQVGWRVGFIGGLRTDKGSDQLQAIAREMKHAWTLVIAGPDRLSVEASSSLLAHGVSVEYASNQETPSDSEMMAGIQSCGVVIAPYRSVTESGSIHLAIGLGVPVVAYRSKGLEHLITDAHLVDGPAELASTIAKIFEGRAFSSYAPVEEQRERAAADWRRAIAN